MAGKQNPLVQEGLRLLKMRPEMSVYAAAKTSGANLQSLYSAVRRVQAKEGDDMPVCPACGGPLKPGQVVKMPAAEPAVPAQTAAGAGVLLRDRLKGTDTAMREEAKRIVLDLTRYI